MNKLKHVIAAGLVGLFTLPAMAAMPDVDVSTITDSMGTNLVNTGTAVLGVVGIGALFTVIFRLLRKA